MPESARQSARAIVFMDNWPPALRIREFAQAAIDRISSLYVLLVAVMVVFSFGAFGSTFFLHGRGATIIFDRAAVIAIAFDLSLALAGYVLYSACIFSGLFVPRHLRRCTLVATALVLCDVLLFPAVQM